MIGTLRMEVAAAMYHIWKLRKEIISCEGSIGLVSKESKEEKVSKPQSEVN